MALQASGALPDDRVLKFVLMLQDGSYVINWIYRAMGAHIGWNVFQLGSTFMEHDLTYIADGAVLTGATLQTHLYEDRMYKTGKVIVGENALIAPGGFALYGSELGTGSSLASHSLLMRNETFQAQSRLSRTNLRCCSCIVPPCELFDIF